MHHLIHLKKIGLMGGRTTIILSQDPPIVGNIGVNNDQSELGVQMARALHQTWQAHDIAINESMVETTNSIKENIFNLGTKMKFYKNLKGDEKSINISYMWNRLSSLLEDNAKSKMPLYEGTNLSRLKCILMLLNIHVT